MMTSRNVKVLGIICIVLVASLIAVTAYFEVQVIGSLNSEISDRDYQISQLTNQNYMLNVTVRNFNETISDLSDIVNFNKSKVVYATSRIVQYPPIQGLDLPARFIDLDHTVIGTMALDSYFNYAGCIIVQINSTSDETYINYTCVSHFGTFDLQADVGMKGTTIFPVLPLSRRYSDYPSQGIFMTVSTHTAVPAKMNITATYYY